MAKKKNRVSPTPFTDKQKASNDWNPLWEEFQKLHPEFLEGFLAFRSIPHGDGPLPPKVKELIMIALNACTTHLYAPGVRRHIQNAIHAGATRAEILHAIELTTVVGIHSCNLAIPILLEEMPE